MSYKLAALALVLALPVAAQARPVYRVMFEFHGRDGAAPMARLVRDEDGNMYGTTARGGSKRCEDALGCGTVFKLTPNGRVKTLHVFKGGDRDGAHPQGGVTIDDEGELYGVTMQGGNMLCRGGCGTLYKITANGIYKLLYRFDAARDGYYPMGSLALGSDDNSYGTTSRGSGRGCGGDGCGTVFKVTPHGKFTMLHRFASLADGAYSAGAMVFDTAGNLYGTTELGGDMTCAVSTGCGSVFKLAPDGTKTTLYSFKSGDGERPYGDLTIDAAGNLYGTTLKGGDHRLGAIFKIAPDGKETTLHSFAGSLENDGSAPMGNQVLDAAGNLYGATAADDTDDPDGHGVVYKLGADGGYTVLHHFQTRREGDHASGLVSDGMGTLYGTMSGLGLGRPEFCGPSGCGTIYKITQ